MRVQLQDGFFRWLASPDGFLLREDLGQWCKMTPATIECKTDNERFELLSWLPEFMSLLDYRAKTSQSGKEFSKIEPNISRCNDLYIRCPDIGPRFFIQHGHSTWVLAQKIGAGFWVNQNVTIGSNGRGVPTLGDNVTVNTGAVVVGPINIGRDVKITANAVVNFDIPDFHTVYAPRAVIVAPRSSAAENLPE